MQHINLIDPRLVPQRQWLPVPALIGMGVVTAAVLGTHLTYETAAMKQVMAASAVPVAQAQAEGAPAAAAAASAAATESAGLQARIDTLEALRAGSRGQQLLPKDLTPTLNAVIASLNGKLWLTEIDVGAGGAVRISGGALDPRALTAMTERLSAVLALKGLPIRVLRIEPMKFESDSGGDAATASAMPAAHRFVLASLNHAGEDTQ